VGDGAHSRNWFLRFWLINSSTALIRSASIPAAKSEPIFSPGALDRSASSSASVPAGRWLAS
jgi:hypothetical protein